MSLSPELSATLSSPACARVMHSLMFESTVVKALLLCIRSCAISKQKQKHACILQQQQQRKLQARMLWRSLKLRKLSLRFVARHDL
eukprot:17193-Heterococcus_DN1.PRE.7